MNYNEINKTNQLADYFCSERGGILLCEKENKRGNKSRQLFNDESTFHRKFNFCLKRIFNGVTKLGHPRSVYN